MSRKSPPWYKRCPADWQKGTRRHAMNFELRGFYSECLDVQWELQGQLPKDDKQLAMLLGTNARMVRALMPKLVEIGKIVETKYGYYNPRMMADILGSEDAVCGDEFAPVSASNEPRLEDESASNGDRLDLDSISKIQKNPMFSTRDLDTDTEIDSNPLTPLQGGRLAEPSEASKTKAKRKPGNYSAEFEAFWSAYPSPEASSKAMAAKSWGKLDADDRAKAVAAVPAYAALLKAKPDRPACHAATFLNQRRWETLLEPAKAQAPQFWWQDPTKLAEMTPDRWRSGIAKYANGQWGFKELGFWPGHKRCLVPREIIKELRLDEKYDENTGLAKGAWKRQQDRLHHPEHAQ